MKRVPQKQVRLFLSENYILVLFISPTASNILYEGTVGNFLCKEILGQFFNYPIYVFIDNIDTVFSTINIEKLTLWHILQLKKRILNETNDSVVSIVKKEKQLHITKTRVSPEQQQLIKNWQRFCTHPVKVSILACSLYSLYPQQPSIALQQKNGVRKVFLYKNGIPEGVIVANENEGPFISVPQALQEMTFKRNDLTFFLPGYNDAKYLRLVHYSLWFLICLFLLFMGLNIVSQIKKYNDAHNLRLNRMTLERAYNEIPQLETKKHQLKTVVPKLTKLESLAKNNINPISVFKKTALILTPQKISSAEFHIDEKEVLHLSFLVNSQGQSNDLVKKLRQSFLPPIIIKLDRKTNTESLLQVTGELHLFKEERK